MTDVDRTVDAGAEKRFFIEMLTKDIELLPAVVDLVDNSVDGARRLHPDGDLHGHWVRVEADSKRCAIADNSGGIDVGTARQYAFRFGRASNFRGVKRSVGQFGVGMKRAIFKLGNHFVVESSFRAGNMANGEYPETDSTFRLEVDVPTWAASKEWKFEFDEVEEGEDLPDDVEAGTSLAVTQLHPSVSDDLDDATVIHALERELRVRHQEAIHRGLDLSVNGRRLSATRPALQFSDLVKPIVKNFDVASGGGTVGVRLFAGTVRRESTEEPDLGDAASFRGSGDAGWYLFCNDRLLMVADKSPLTGWGSPAASYHPQYRMFRGYVYLSADDAALLPWNTTKTAVDRDSPVFRAVANEMKTALVAVQAAINTEKNVRASYKDASQAAEAAGEDSPAKPELVSALEQAPDTPLVDLDESPRIELPPVPPKVRSKPRAATIKRIQYEVDIDIFDRVAAVLDATSGSEVGRLTFDYFVEEELD